MAAWDKIKAFAKVADAVNDVKQTASDIKNNGVVTTVKNRLKRKAYRKMGKLAIHATKTFLRFLATPPWGWAVAAGLLFLLLPVLTSNGDSSAGIDNGIGAGKVTKEQYAAMQTGCPSEDVGGQDQSLYNRGDLTGLYLRLSNFQSNHMPQIGAFLIVTLLIYS